MFRLGATCPPERLADAVRALRPLTSLSIAELRDRLADGRAVAAFRLDEGVEEVRRCRAFLQVVDAVGATATVYESLEDGDEREESLDYLRNVMRRSLQIRRDVLKDADREAGAE